MTSKTLTRLLLLFCLPCLLVSAKRKNLVPYTDFDDLPIRESSGIVKSRQFPNTYWTHNDSGNSARIFAINARGKAVDPHKDKAYKGIEIKDTANIDWEDIATDNEGHLYIADLGNNHNTRRNLSIIKIAEPDPASESPIAPLSILRVAFPDQVKFPPPLSQRNFDCEALFHANGKLYILSKNQGNRRTGLYCLESVNPDIVNLLTFVDTFEIRGQVTAADALSDGAKIAILTYNRVWTFDKPIDNDNYFTGNASTLRIKAKQCEAICWQDENTFLITNEQADLFRLSASELKNSGY